MTEIQHSYIIYLLAVLMGASFGSFVTLASYRLPLGEDIVKKPSRCPKCKTHLGVKDLFPILSWLVQGGTCRYCKTPIHFRYPLTELLLAFTFLLITWCFGPTIQTVLLCLLATELAIMIVTDFEHTIIPDSVQVALFITGIVYAIYHNTEFSEPVSSAAAGLALGLALHFGYPYFRKKEGLGFGDVKFLFVAGIWIPLAAWPVFLFIAGLVGTVFGLIWTRGKPGEIFPFGPALAFSLFLTVCVPNLLGRFL